ncbi:hypothetical protein [Kitasatospora indigofera]|uniref:hypothetical protein n=1 Tax=Kitasatospora indigofera TaxID=67307 RepID=UPI0033B64020
MAELENWTCEYGGLLMGAPDSAISLVQVDGLLTLPEVRTSDLVLVQRDGLWAGDDYLNGRAVTLTVEVYGRDQTEFATALAGLQAAFRAGRAELPLRFRFPGLAGGRTAWVRVRPRKRSAPLDLNFAYGVCNVAIELYATDPKIYADSSRAVPVTTSLTPPTDPVSRFTVVGSVPAKPVIDIPYATNPRITDDVTDAFFALTYSGRVRIDSAKQTVIGSMNEDISSLVVEGSTWPEYEYGEHHLRLTADDTAVVTAEVSWVEAWT